MGNSAPLFKDMAKEWWDRYLSQGNYDYACDCMKVLEREVFPKIGNMSVDDITTKDVLDIIRAIEDAGTPVKARKVKSHIYQTLRYCVSLGCIRHNPAADLNWALKPYKSAHFVTMTDHDDIANLMCEIDCIDNDIRRLSLMLHAYTFVRSGELVSAEWKDISFEERLWKIPAEKMKMKRPHVVPLSKQVIELLNELKEITGSGQWLFPSRWSKKESCGGVPYENPNVNSVYLRRMGYGGKIVPHGFRAMAGTILSEQEWPSEVIELQLAHVDSNQVRAAYQRSERLSERANMMQAWADFLDLRLAQGVLNKRRKWRRIINHKYNTKAVA